MAIGIPVVCSYYASGIADSAVESLYPLIPRMNSTNLNTHIVACVDYNGNVKGLN